jgi:hypothetical protein
LNEESISFEGVRGKLEELKLFSQATIHLGALDKNVEVRIFGTTKSYRNDVEDVLKNLKLDEKLYSTVKDEMEDEEELEKLFNRSIASGYVSVGIHKLRHLQLYLYIPPLVRVGNVIDVDDEIYLQLIKLLPWANTCARRSAMNKIYTREMVKFLKSVIS